MIGESTEYKLEQLERDLDGLHWKYVHLERRLNSLESELRRLRR